LRGLSQSPIVRIVGADRAGQQFDRFVGAHHVDIDDLWLRYAAERFARRHGDSMNGATRPYGFELRWIAGIV